MHTYQDYTRYNRKMGLLHHAASILDSYDGLLSVPENGNNIRAEQVALMKEMGHSMLTNFDYRELLLKLSNTANLSEIQRQNVKLSLKKTLDASRVESDFVHLLSTTRSASVDAYYRARENNDFALFAPYLEKVVALTREYTTFHPGFATPYDAMLDEYDR